MKNLKNIAIIVIAVLFFSCDTEDNPGEDRLVGTISADIGELNIINFQSDKKLTETTGSANTAGSLKNFSIKALDKFGRVMILEVGNLYKGKVETFDLKDYGGGRYANLRFGSLTDGDESVWEAGKQGDSQKRGELSITFVSSDMIKGTFYANGYDDANNTTKKVRNGKFEIQLIK